MPLSRFVIAFLPRSKCLLISWLQSLSMKNAECQRIDALELWCWRRLLRVPLTAGRSVNPKGNQPWMFIGRTDAEAPILWPPDAKSWLTGKDPDARKDWRQKEKGTTEDEMVRRHHWFNRHEFEQIVGDCRTEEPGMLQLDTTWPLNKVTVHSDFGAQENKIYHCFHFFPLYLSWSDGTRCYDLGFLNVKFQTSFLILLFPPHQEAL